MIVRRSALQPIDFDGLRIFDYTAELRSGSSLAVIEVPPGATHAEAWSRRSDKYYLVVAGRLEFSLHGERLALEEGDFCLVEQGKRFSYANRSASAARLVLIHTPSFDLEAEVFEPRAEDSR
jgi:mannose-6-phosphate isomerase-like protein (cupin superfamily)